MKLEDIQMKYNEDNRLVFINKHVVSLLHDNGITIYSNDIWYKAIDKAISVLNEAYNEELNRDEACEYVTERVETYGTGCFEIATYYCYHDIIKESMQLLGIESEISDILRHAYDSLIIQLANELLKVLEEFPKTASQLEYENNMFAN